MRIKPGETVPLKFQESERAFMLNEILLVSKELEKKLRFAVMEGEGFVVRLNLDELDELAGTIAAEANHCKNKKKQKQWDRIYTKIHNLLNTFTDNDEAPQTFEEFLNVLIPPEISNQIQATIQGKEFHSLEELNTVMSEIIMNHNRQPQDDMGGLSPEQVTHLIYADWDNPHSVFRLNTEISSEEILKTPIIQDTQAFLTGFIKESGSIKATSAGKLNRQFIQKMIKVFGPPPEFVAWTLKYKTTLNEDDVFHIHIVRILLESAGLIRKQKTVFKITKKGENYTRREHATELYTLLFKTYFQKFNLAYLDGMPENEPLQSTITYTFYTIGKHLQEWKKTGDISEEITLPIVQDSVYEHQDLDIQIRTRILDPLTRFGLLDSRELPKEEKRISRDYEYRKTALYDKFI